MRVICFAIDARKALVVIDIEQRRNVHGANWEIDQTCANVWQKITMQTYRTKTRNTREKDVVMRCQIREARFVKSFPELISSLSCSSAKRETSTLVPRRSREKWRGGCSSDLELRTRPPEFSAGEERVVEDSTPRHLVFHQLNASRHGGDTEIARRRLLGFVSENGEQSN